MANVSRESAETVSNQMTAIWNNFDDGSKSLEYYADVMTALGAATASSTKEISDGLEKFAAIGESVGLSYEYATAALATITSNTRQSADVVGTALKTLFARIQGLSLGETLEDGTDLNKYSEALAKVGISIKDSSGGLKDMDNILDEMAAKWDTLNNDQ
jgi:TP901 family phage tail tape measure protein